MKIVSNMKFMFGTSIPDLLLFPGENEVPDEKATALLGLSDTQERIEAGLLVVKGSPKVETPSESQPEAPQAPETQPAPKLSKAERKAEAKRLAEQAKARAKALEDAATSEFVGPASEAVSPESQETSEN